MASKLSSGASAAAGSSVSKEEKSSPAPKSTSSSSSTKSSSSPSKSTSSVAKGASSASKNSVAQSLSSGSSGGGSSSRTSTASSRTTNSITPGMSKSLSDSSRDMSSSSSSQKARDAYAKADAKRNGGGSMWGRSADPAVVDKLLTFEALQNNMRALDALRPLEEEAAAQPLFYEPSDERVARAGGAPFEGMVDWGGIAANLFQGQSAAERDAAMLAGRTPAAPRFDPVGGEGPSWAQFDDYVNNTDAFGPRRDPESGFVKDPVTGTYYREDLLPGSEMRLADNPVASQQFPSFAPLNGLMDGIAAEGARLNGEVMPPLPRPDPRGGIVAENLPGQVEGGVPIEIEVRGGNGVEESDEARYAREHPVEAPKKPSAWDSVVEMGGGLLEHTGLGGIVKSLFPDIWYGAGETLKGLDSGSSGSSRGTNFEYLPQNGSLSEQSDGYYYPPGFIDANGNGIDDRYESGTPPPYVPSAAPNPRVASFPNIPPYNPGRDNEWTYFTNNRLAQGGIVHAYADGGPVAAEDPKMEIIAGTEDVLEKIAAGGKPDERDTVLLKKFVEMFGDGALRSLNDNVAAGMKMNGGASGRMVRGPGTGTSDSIPALINGTEPAALSDGEYVLPAAAVAGAGDGDPEKGAAALTELSERLAAGARA